MRKKPIIGITTSMDTQKHFLNSAYILAIGRAGGVPVLLPSADHISRAIDAIDGLLLSGGGDIDGAFLGEPTHEMAADIWPQRDEAEIAAARAAYARNMPILGICRGLQILNVALGGGIVQHIEGHKQSRPRNMPAHGVHVGGRLAQIMGMSDVMVNSTHHQAADRYNMAEGLEICATAPDGTVEALCCADKPFVLGVQWHPEELIDMPEHFRIFQEFVVSILAN
ncbi:MAG: gamma-glutamyl-gamma-aminobutyrate hydrolase family protein [Clostridiales bacterium]|jgi:putative glutamine amidotransferase|nr:gamma-glutamyl-gamma-aminobutyrate hydrolase family protein [Clostridiales bacterium]